MIRISQAQAAHFVLRQNYLAGQPGDDLLPLIRQLIGLPGDPDASAFLAARARLAHFQFDQLNAALFQTRTLLKSPLMRSASYIVEAERYPIWHVAAARQRNQDANSEFRLWGLDPAEVERLEKVILELDDWPATAETISARLPLGLVRELSQTSRSGRVTTTSNVALILRWLVAKGRLGTSFDTPSGMHLAGASHLIYAPLTLWYPNLDLSAAPGEAEAQAELVRAYLAAFGPASEADISFWSGFGKSETARAIATLARQTTLALVEGIPGMLLLLKAQTDALQAVSTPAEPIINLLPADDPFTTAHRASRSRYFSDQKLQRLVFSSSGAPQPTIVVNGQIVGVWAWAEEEQRLTWQLLAEVDPALHPLIQREIEYVSAFIQGRETGDG
ncbi:MAG: crosslink repair DNA glycosylase YcaQ family protein [Anaerolineae bacterium]